ncbi:MAG TPA: hypothetical protein VFI92_04435 [Steroidobacteraceae bacterium]|nr:hypothetical protein [Steroidobacteraceae bacterium]
MKSRATPQRRVTKIRSVPIFRRRRSAILLVALVTFWLAQAMAVAHASRHLGADAPGLPGDHAQLCTDCASLLPLLCVAGGLGAALALLRPARRVLLPAVDVRAVSLARHRAFRSRAPPR